MYYEGISKQESIKNINKLHDFVNASISQNTLSLVEWQTRRDESEKHLDNFIENYDAGNKDELFLFMILFGKVVEIRRSFNKVNHKIKDWEGLINV